MEWISVEDRLPEPRTHVLGWAAPGYIGIQYCIEDSNQKMKILALEDEDYERVAVTHWMPLPPPPEEKVK
jgi:hypothetical protein